MVTEKGHRNHKKNELHPELACAHLTHLTYLRFLIFWGLSGPPGRIFRGTSLDRTGTRWWMLGKKTSVPKHVGLHRNPQKRLTTSKSSCPWTTKASAKKQSPFYDGVLPFMVWWDLVWWYFQSQSSSNLARRSSQTGGPMISGCKNSTTLASS